VSSFVVRATWRSSAEHADRGAVMRVRAAASSRVCLTDAAAGWLRRRDCLQRCWCRARCSLAPGCLPGPAAACAGVGGDALIL
jgi:hypothetical protein